MPKSANQKLKLIRMAEIFLKETDEEHGITVHDLAERLEQEEIVVERKTIYSDIEDLRRVGLDIESAKEGRQVKYYLLSRSFELAELKLLVDSVQAAKFITEKKSRTLIQKLEELTSTYQARQLHRQVIITGRVKADNEAVYYAVDRIYNAIDHNRQITFHYFQWNARKEKVFRHDGALYRISPWSLIWDDEYYYLLGYDAKAGKMKHYRVDKMMDIQEAEELRSGGEVFAEMNMPAYSRGLFGMFGGNEAEVTLRCSNEKAAVILDRFGTDILLIPDGGDSFTVRLQVSLSRQFLAWIISLGDGVEVISPEEAVEMMRSEILRLSKLYSH